MLALCCLVFPGRVSKWIQDFVVVKPGTWFWQHICVLSLFVSLMLPLQDLHVPGGRGAPVEEQKRGIYDAAQAAGPSLCTLAL